MAGIQESEVLAEQWKERGTDTEARGAGNNYYPRLGDFVQFHFLWTGQDGDPYFERYIAHEIPPTRPGGFADTKYCPKESLHDLNYQCSYCAAGNGEFKKRFRVWLYISNVFRTGPLKEGENLPLVNFNGRQFYQWQVNKAMLWDSSAWRDGALPQIVRAWESLGHNLMATGFNLQVEGQGFQRRNNVWPVLSPMVPVPPELMQQIKDQMRPVRDILMEEITKTPLVAAPAAVAVAPAPAAMFQPPAAQYTPPPAPAPMAAPAPALPFDSPKTGDTFPAPAATPTTTAPMAGSSPAQSAPTGRGLF